MAYGNYNDTLAFRAGSDFRGDQFRIVELTGNAHEVDLAGLGDAPVGVLQNNPNSGEAATVLLAGISKCIAGGTVNAGKKVSAAATGFATQTISGGVELAVFGRAMTAASSGGIFTLLIAPSVTIDGTFDFLAGSDFGTDQFKIVAPDAVAGFVELSAVGDLPIGVVQNSPGSGGVAIVALSGIVSAVAGAAITAGKKVSAAATGFATQTISGGIEIAVFGRALTTAASGDNFSLLIAPSVTVSGDAN
jgi:hypothetical protein